MSEISKQEQAAVDTIVKSIRAVRGCLGYYVNGELIAMLPESVVHYYFVTNEKARNKNVTRKEINRACRDWYYNTAISAVDPVFLNYLHACSHEWAHWKLNHDERRISPRQAELEARDFADRVWEMLALPLVLDSRKRLVSY